MPFDPSTTAQDRPAQGERISLSPLTLPLSIDPLHWRKSNGYPEEQQVPRARAGEAVSYPFTRTVATESASAALAIPTSAVMRDTCADAATARWRASRLLSGT